MHERLAEECFAPMPLVRVQRRAATSDAITTAILFTELDAILPWL